jgi:hypothetical protein
LRLPTQIPIWDVIADRMKMLPPEVFERLPEHGASCRSAISRQGLLDTRHAPQFAVRWRGFLRASDLNAPER